MSKHGHLLFVRLIYCLLFALSLLGCAGPLTQPREFGFLPSAEVVNAEKARLAMPPKLRAKLNDVACKVAEDDRPNPRYLAQNKHDPLEGVKRKVVVALLEWAIEEAAKSESGLIPPTSREIQPLPPLVVEGPVVEPTPPLEDPLAQFGGGFGSGASIGAVPLGPNGADVAIQLRLLPNGTYWARVGRVCGEAAVGIGQIAVGCTGMSAGAGMTTTGGGAAVGVPMIVDSLAIAANGCATTLHAAGDGYALFRDGTPPEAPPPPSQVKLLAPKPKPVAQAPVATAPAPAAKPAQAPRAAPVETKTTTRYKSTGKTVTTKPSGTTTTTREKGAPSQSTTPVKQTSSTAPKATTPYARPNGATTPAQRASVQGKPCVDCGTVAPRQIADHKKPLVKEHYETGTIDKSRMRSNDAVQPQCPTCSARQGAEMSQYSREQRQRLKDTAP
jgi:hypothetical protein